MRACWIGAAMLMLAACGQDAAVDASDGASGLPGLPGGATAESVEPEAEKIDFAAISDYDENWHLSPGWPGEYPGGFSVIDPDVKVPARMRPVPSDPQDVTCQLPEFANYQIWNRERTQSDNLVFFVASLRAPVTLNQDAQVEHVANSGVLQTLDLVKGDVLTFLRYEGEGFMVVSYKGVPYNINESELRDISDIASIVPRADEWVRVTCLGGKQAWLLYSEVLTEEGIGPSPLSGFGESADLTPEEVMSVREIVESSQEAPPL